MKRNKVSCCDYSVIHVSRPEPHHDENARVLTPDHHPKQAISDITTLEHNNEIISTDLLIELEKTLQENVYLLSNPFNWQFAYTDRYVQQVVPARGRMPTVIRKADSTESILLPELSIHPKH